MENDKKQDNEQPSDFKTLLDAQNYKFPKVGDIIKGTVISASKSEVRLDIDGIMAGIVRGPDLYSEAEEYASLKPGDDVDATVIMEENEFGDLELSFRHVGQEKAWNQLMEAYEQKKNVKVKVISANKGGLIVNFRQIGGFLPVSHLSPENYPRVDGGDKGKILEKLKSFVGKEVEVRPINLDDKEDKIIFSEKEAWLEKRKDIISQYQVGSIVEGTVTAVTDFGVFIKFGDNLEGLVHISELAWQRIDSPSSLYRVGDTINAQIIEMEGTKIFLSAKKLIDDPWKGVGRKFIVGQAIEGKVLKINPFGLFVSLDDDIHGLAHINSLNLAPGQKATDIYKEGEVAKFTILTIEPEEHRLGLAAYKESAGGEDLGSKEEKEEKSLKDEENSEKPDKKEKKKAKSKKEEDLEA